MFVYCLDFIIETFTDAYSSKILRANLIQSAVFGYLWYTPASSRVSALDTVARVDLGIFHFEFCFCICGMKIA